MSTGELVGREAGTYRCLGGTTGGMANDVQWNMDMKKVFSITEVKALFSKLLRRAAAGEEITITKWGVPVARLVPIRKRAVAR
jgi:prevent-host-death family protein